MMRSALIYCQNREISLLNPTAPDHELPGREVEIPELIDVFYDLSEQGAHNINLVTADHYIPEIAEAVKEAKKLGFDLPFVFNCSGYETVESLKILEGLIDIYLTECPCPYVLLQKH